MKNIFVFLFGCFLVYPPLATGSILSDRRATSTQAEDHVIESQAFDSIRDRFKGDAAVKLSVLSFNRVALVTGFVPDQATKAEVGQIVAKVEKVRVVINEVFVGPPGGMMTYATDMVLATRVRAALSDSRGFNGNGVKVVTESGTVFLMGLVTRLEKVLASEIAARVPGTRRVVQAFEVITEDQARTIAKGDGLETDVAKGVNTPSLTHTPRQSDPPRSTLVLSASASQADHNGVVTLTITTSSDTASLKVNGDEEGGRADGRYSVRRFARVGENKFEVVATDRFGNTQRQTVSVVREPADTTVRFATLNPGALRGKPANNTVAIIIGIQDYRRVPKAEFANNDARVFYDYAIRGLGVRPENVKLLVDQQADDVEILGAFKNWLPLKAKRGQTDVYVFYSGHGLPSDDGASLYFLPHGVDRQFLDRTAIKQAEIVSALQAVSPKSVTLFLDACYSGQSRGGETLLASARPIAIQPKASTFPSNFTVLSASAPEQIASSSPDLKHGIFSYFLMKGMEGEADQNKDGSITVAEMQAYLSESVGRKAMSINRTQQPQLVGDQSRVLVGR